MGRSVHDICKEKGVALLELAERANLDLLRVQAKQDFGRGMHRAAAESGDAAPWIAANLEALEVIERKIYNTHDFGENLGLAFTFPPRIQPQAVH